MTISLITIIVEEVASKIIEFIIEETKSKTYIQYNSLQR
jgi:hypothetical protein